LLAVLCGSFLLRRLKDQNSFFNGSYKLASNNKE